MLTGCSVQYPVVGRFDNHNEIFKGSVVGNVLSGTGYVEAEGLVSRTKCVGPARITYVPSSFISVAGQRGIAELECDEGRRIRANYTGSAEAYQIFRAGAADSAVLSPVNGIPASNDGFRTLVTYAQEGTTQLQGSIVMPLPLIKSDTVTAEKFIRGTLKVLLYAHENRADAVKIYSRNNSVNEQIGGQIYDHRAQGMTKDGIASEEAQRKSVEEVIDRVGVKTIPPLETIYDCTLLRKIQAELKAKG